MILNIFVRFFALSFLMLSNLATLKASEPLILNDFGKLKRISEFLHHQKNSPLSQELRENHNFLAHEVNEFIDAIELYVKQGTYPQTSLEEVERKITEINRKASLIYSNEHNARKSQLDNNIEKIRWIDFENIRMLVEWVMKDRDASLKESFINKLNQRKWALIPER